MNREEYAARARRILEKLCLEITDRSVGSAGNRMATTFFMERLQQYHWQIEETLLSVMDWQTCGASLRCGDETFEIFSSPYSLGCMVSGELAAAASAEELIRTGCTGRILLLHGPIASEQIMPKNFVFYNPEEHQRIISMLEELRPAAIICATGRNAALAGGVYPFPMFEDGDFDIPSVYMKDVDGDRLLAWCGKQAILDSRAERIPETAFNIVGRKAGSGDSRIVITAHIDAKKGTPGAIDNATGVAVLLLLAEMLRNHSGNIEIELVALNGEDYYAVPGQMEYIRQNEGRFGEILLNINIDGAGYREGISCFSPFGLPDGIRSIMEEVLKNNPALVEGPPWYQGDHSIFVQYGRPAIAVSSKWFIDHIDTQDITHTPKDNLDIVDVKRVVEIAAGIRELIDRMEEAVSQRAIR